MKVWVFSTKSYDEYFLTETAQGSAHESLFSEDRLRAKMAGIAARFEVVCAFVNDVNRRFYRALNGVCEGNVGIDGVLGFDLHGSKAGIAGPGTIGLLTPTVGRIVGYDLHPNP